MLEPAKKFWRQFARSVRPALAASRAPVRADRRAGRRQAIEVWRAPLARPFYVRASSRRHPFDTLRGPLGRIPSPFGSQSGSAAKRFAKGKREVISWAFDDPSADMGSVYINSDANPSLNFDSKNNAAILAKFTGWSATSPMTTMGPTGLLKNANHNLLLRSEEFDNAIYTKSSLSVSANATTAPDGTATADKLIEAAATAQHFIYQTLSLTSGVSYRFSVRLKAAERSWAVLSLGGTFAINEVWFNLTSGVVGTVSGTVVASSITADVDGYFICSVTCTATSTGSAPIYVKIANADNSNSYLGDGASGIYIWGYDLKQFPVHSTEYIKTTSSAVYSIPTTYDTSGNKLGFLSWEARTNAAWWSRDLTQSAHVRTNSTGYKTARGTDGELNSASRLVATAANGNVIQTITATSAQRVSSARVRRAKGSGTVKMSQGETTGSEKVTNGTFASDLSGWTNGSVGTGSFAFSSGKARCTTIDGSNYGRLYQAMSGVTVGKLYRLSFTITRISGAPSFYVDALTGGPVNNYSEGTTTLYFVATSTSVTINFQTAGNAAGVFDLDDVSFYECTETSLSLNAVAYSEVSGTELKSTGTTALIGSATAATYDTGTGALSVTRVDVSNQSHITFAGLTAGKMYAIDLASVSGSIDVRQSNLSVVETVVASTVVYTIPNSTSIFITASSNGSTGTATVTSIKEVEPSQAWTEAETAAATITNPCVAIWCATSGDAIDVDHVQCEVGAKASPPIITAGAAVTRAAGSLSIALSMLPSVSSGAMLVVWSYAKDNAANQFLATIFKDGNNYSAIRNDNSGTGAQLVGLSGGALVGNVPLAANYAYDALRKTAGRYELNNMNISYQGAAGTNDTSCALPVGADTLMIGGLGPGANIGCQIISRIKLVCEAGIADATLNLETA